MGNFLTSKELSLITPIADALKVSLVPWADSSSGVSRVRNKSTMKMWDLPLCGDISVPMRLKVMGSRIQGEISSVLFEVAGDLLLYAYYNRVSEHVSIALLTRAKINSKTQELQDTAWDYGPLYFLNKYRRAVVAAFTKKRDQGLKAHPWRRIDVVNLDDGFLPTPDGGVGGDAHGSEASAGGDHGAGGEQGEAGG
jgi:hypothetical protein